MLAKRALRRTALGVDRNHDRYWTFPSASPGLYIEKGLKSVLLLDRIVVP